MKARRLQRLSNDAGRRIRAGLKRFVRGAGLEDQSTISTPEPTDAPPDLSACEGIDTALDRPHSPYDDPEDVDRLVRLTFNALLRREPDEEILAAYRAGFARGTTVHGLIDDVLGSDEYRAAIERSKRLRAVPNVSTDATLAPVRLDDMQAAVQFLAARLAAKGCRLQIGDVVQETDASDADNRRRMRSLRLTLAMLDRL